MPDVPGTYSYPEGMTPGQRAGGGWSQNLYGDSGLEDHATFFPDGASEDRSDSEDARATDGFSPSTGQTLLGAIVLAGVSVALTVAAPRVKKWATNSAMPELHRGWISRADRDGASGDGRVPELVAVSEAITHEPSMAIDQTLEDPRELISSSEAQRELAELLIAAAAVAERVRRLTNARIDDDPEFPALKRAMDQLTDQHVVNAINLMFRGNVSDQNGELVLELLRRFDARPHPRTGLPSLARTDLRDALSFEGDGGSGPDAGAS